jgi:hypothetical protein
VGVGVVNPDLKHRETAPQFDRASLGTFLRGEFRLDSPIDFDRKYSFWQFGGSRRHPQSFIGVTRAFGTLSPAPRTSLVRPSRKEYAQ